MANKKNFYWNSTYNLSTYLFDMYFYNGSDELVHTSHVEHPGELKMHVEAVKNHLLAINNKIVRREIETLNQRRKEYPTISGMPLKEAVAIQEYTSDKPLQKALSERKGIYALSR